MTSTIDGSARDRLVVALDVDPAQALRLARSLQGRVRLLKVGMTLFYASGPEIVRHIRDLGFDVFLDLKLHDIPHQVAGAAQVVSELGVQMLTVHASGGSAMVASAVEGARRGAAEAGVDAPAILAVTVLTSMDDPTLRAVGIERGAAEQVPLLARVASEGGADGVICSPQEAVAMRRLLGDAGLVVTPGVRPAWADTGDQSRIATPAAAFAAGASHLVIGRPVTAAAVPTDAVERIVEEIEEANGWPTA